MHKRMLRLTALLCASWLTPLAAQPAQQPVELPASAGAEISPEQRVDGIQSAVERHDFSGVVVYQRDGQLDALSVRHDKNGAELQRLTGPALAPGTVGAAVGEQVSLEPDGLLFARSGLKPGESTVPVREAYQLRALPEDRVAGRTAHVVDLLARDALRYSRRLWIDGDSGLVLRSATFGADGQMVEQWMFTQIALLPAAAGSGSAAPVQGSSPQGSGRLHSTPAGFKLVSSSSAAQGEHWVYCDGLARVSVFIEPLRSNRASLSGLQRRGLLSVFGRVVSGHQIVVVGEVPPATVERFAQEIVLDRAG